MKVAEIKRMFGFFKENPDGIAQIKDMFPEKTYNKREFKQWFINCLNNKINREDKRDCRKFNSDWHFETLRFSRLVNSNAIIHWIPSDFRNRFQPTKTT
jgi:hypothetical protein